MADQGVAALVGLDDLTDAEIIGRSVRDPDMFGELFRRYRADVFRFVTRRVGRSNAADLTADVFVRAFSVRARYDTSRSSAQPWLYGIAANVVGDQLRRWLVRSRKHALGAVRLLERPTEPFGQVLSDMEAEALSDEIETALSGLPPSQRAALVLYGVEGLSYVETAEVLGVAVGTVKSRIHRAKSHIRSNLTPGLAKYLETRGQDWEEL